MIATASSILTLTATNSAMASASANPVLLQVVQNIPSPIIDGFDVRTLMGLSGITFVESFVKYLQRQWRLPTTGMLPVLASLASGIALNVLLAWYLHMDLSSAVVTGAFTGVGASGWHAATK